MPCLGGKSAGILDSGMKDVQVNVPTSTAMSGISQSPAAECDVEVGMHPCEPPLDQPVIGAGENVPSAHSVIYLQSAAGAASATTIPASAASELPGPEVTSLQAQEIRLSTFYRLVSSQEIVNDNGAWLNAPEWLEAEKAKINALDDFHARHAIFISHAQKERDPDVRCTKRLVAAILSDSGGWSLPRGYWADWLHFSKKETSISQQEVLKSIDSGVENCRKFVCFLSREFLLSWYCLHELALAIKLNKCVIVANVEDVGRITFQDVWQGMERFDGQIHSTEVMAAVDFLTKGPAWHRLRWKELVSSRDAFKEQLWPLLDDID
eukprot:jgi/Mesvir1/8773/Mv02686-RA.1